VGTQIKNFKAQVQIVQPKFLISKTQAHIAQEKINRKSTSASSARKK